MPDQNSNATAGDNAGNTNSDTSTDNKNEGNNSSNTSNDNKQNEGANNNHAKTFTQDEVNSLLAKERKAAEKKAADAEGRAKLSEDERVKAERDDALKQLRLRDTRDAVIEAAAAAGVKNAKLFWNAYNSEIETDEKTGKITNLKDVLAVAKTDAPELFEVKRADGSADGGEGKNAGDAKPEFKGGMDRMSYAYKISAEKNS